MTVSIIRSAGLQEMATTAETPTMRHEAYMDSEKTFCRRCGAVEGTDAWADGVCPGWTPADHETPMMGERLARANYIGSCAGIGIQGRDWEQLSDEPKDVHRAAIDAILREMLEPSEGMIIAANPKCAYRKREKWCGSVDCPCVTSVHDWQTMIQHILNETKD